MVSTEGSSFEELSDATRQMAGIGWRAELVGYDFDEGLILLCEHPHRKIDTAFVIKKSCSHNVVSFVHRGDSNFSRKLAPAIE